MIKKLKQLLVIGLASSSLLLPSLIIPTLNGVASADITSNLCSGATSASGNGSTNCGQTSGQTNLSGGLNAIAQQITKWFSIIVGAVSIIMIIYGGFRYITSGGDSGKVGSAKNTIIYAIIGLIIVALAQLIVNLVLGNANNATSSFSGSAG